MLPNFLQAFLATPATSAIAHVLSRGGARTGVPCGEVSAVRSMTLDGFDEIATAWSPILRAHGYKLELQAIFCHSRPQVRYPRVPSPFAPATPIPDARCELADLLIVVDYRDPATRVLDRRAVLVQAKMLKGGAIRPSGKEWLQHELLAWLPTFQFVEAAYDRRPRDLGGLPFVGDPAFTSEYGSLDLTAAAPEWRHWLPQTTIPCFTSDIDLGTFLANMVTGDGTCSREAVEGGNDDWSYTVDELLKVTAAKPIVKAVPTVLRGNSNVVGFFIDTTRPADRARFAQGTTAAGGDDDDGFEGFIEEWPDGPISTVQMTISGLDDWRPE